jgi:hypothetical protein
MTSAPFGLSRGWNTFSAGGKLPSAGSPALISPESSIISRWLRGVSPAVLTHSSRPSAPSGTQLPA